MNPILLKLAPYLIAIAIVSGGWWYIDHLQAKLDALQHEYSQFVADTKAKGEQAQKDAEEKDKANQRNKEIADHDYQTSIDSLSADVKRLRDQERARGRLLPPAAPSAKHPERATINRALTESAYSRLAEGLQGVGESGDIERTGLNDAKAWAQHQ